MIIDSSEYIYGLDCLKKHPIFKRVDEEDLKSLLREFTLVKWNKNQEFIHSAENYRNFHVIIKGRVKMYQTDPVSLREFTLFILTKKDVFDIVAVLDGNKHTTDFKALDDVDVLCIPMDKARQWIDKHTEINKALLPYLAHKMRMLEINLTDNVLSDIPTRLAKLILHNVDQSSKKLKLINDLSHDELASLIGSTRAVVNRHLQSLKQDGIIDTKRKLTQVKNIKALIHKIENRFAQ